MRELRTREHAGATLDLAGFTLSLSGDLANSGTIDATTAGSTLTLTGTANQLVDAGTSTLGNLTVNKEGGTGDRGYAFTLAGNMTRTAGALAMGTKP